MRSSPHALATALALLGLSAWAQVGAGPLAPLAAPPTYPSAPQSTAVRPMSPALPAVGPRSPAFAPAGVAGAARSTPDGRAERRFLRDAAAQSRFELDASQLAFAKSSNAGVRTLAASMINHNKTIGLELAHLLSSRGMALPMLGDAHRKTLKQLAKLNGSKFDSTYLERVGLSQAGVAREFEKAAQVVGDAQINAWIVKNQPTTRYHQMLAEKASQPAELARSNRAAPRPGAMKVPIAGAPVVPSVVTVRPGRDASAGGFQPLSAPSH